MDGFEETTRIRMLGAYCESDCQGNYYTQGQDASKPLLGTTPKDHVKQVALAFKAPDRRDRQLDQFGNHSKLLQRQYKDMITSIDQPSSTNKHLPPKSSSEYGNLQKRQNRSTKAI
jgi:hypothetical protein